MIREKLYAKLKEMLGSQDALQDVPIVTHLLETQSMPVVELTCSAVNAQKLTLLGRETISLTLRFLSNYQGLSEINALVQAAKILEAKDLVLAVESTVVTLKLEKEHYGLLKDRVTHEARLYFRAKIKRSDAQ